MKRITITVLLSLLGELLKQIAELNGEIQRLEQRIEDIRDR